MKYITYLTICAGISIQMSIGKELNPWISFLCFMPTYFLLMQVCIQADSFSFLKKAVEDVRDDLDAMITKYENKA